MAIIKASDPQVGFFIAYPVVTGAILGGIVLLAIIMLWLFPEDKDEDEVDEK